MPIARERLGPLGVTIVDVSDDPIDACRSFADGEFDLVINRHEYSNPTELRRILSAGGLFITQQVGDRNNVELNEWLLPDAPEDDPDEWRVETAVRQLAEAGFRTIEAQETFPAARFMDIGAVVYYLKAVPWQVEGFSVDTFRDRLLAMHEQILAQGAFVARSHRFLVRAVRE